MAVAATLFLYLDRPYPVYYFPQNDVEMQYLTVSSKIETDPDRGDRIFWNMSAGSSIAENAASTYIHPPVSGHADLSSYINFDWDVMDSWFEEEEEVFRHPRNPYHRIDALLSARNLDILADNQRLAQTKTPVVLFETGLPARYYINSKDIYLDALEPSDTVTLCPYKGAASYFNIRTDKQLTKDGAWCYTDPIPECIKIKGLICFYNKFVDIIEDE